MSQPFEIDTDALGRAEAPFRELSGQLSALSDQVQERVRSLGSVWGDDESGQQFVAQYGPARDQLIEAFRSTSDVVHSTADGVHTMSQGFGRTEDGNREVNESLLARMRGAEPDAADSASTTPTHYTTAREAAVPGVPATARLRATDVSVPAEAAQSLQTPTTPLTPLRRVAVDAPTVAPAQRTGRLLGAEPATAAQPTEWTRARRAADLGVPAERAHDVTED